jgi:hypothetical protein
MAAGLMSLGWSGCGAKSCSCREPTAADPPGSSETEPSASAPDVPEGIRLHVDSSLGEHSLRVEIHGRHGARLSPEGSIERGRGDGTFAQVVPYRLIASCGDSPPDCLALTPGAELRPIAWSHVVGDGGQCGCEHCRPADPGEYRFVLATCDGARIEGASFTVER